METWIEWGGFPRALQTSEPPIILSFFWSKILSRIQEKPSFKTNVCVPTRISGGDELTFSENSQPLLHILNYVVVFWSGRDCYSICVCDVQINILFFVSIFWLISPILFLLCFRMKKKKKWRCAKFLHFQIIPSNSWSNQHEWGGDQVEPPTVSTFGLLHAGESVASFTQGAGGRGSAWAHFHPSGVSTKQLWCKRRGKSYF